jgi:hypothetical protein
LTDLLVKSAPSFAKHHGNTTQRPPEFILNKSQISNKLLPEVEHGVNVEGVVERGGMVQDVPEESTPGHPMPQSVASGGG